MAYLREWVLRRFPLSEYWHYMKLSGQFDAPAALPQGKNRLPHFQLNGSFYGPQGLSGRYWRKE
jgi:hypothetical protein